VTEPSANPQAGGRVSPSPTTAGALLRAARVSAGLSIDNVAQQLKLAPRQVTALEEDDYTHLPGRTFVRGFVRNYARMVGLDADTVLGTLGAGSATPALAAPTLQPTAPTMGELPVSDHARPGFARWSIPLILAGIVVVAALYEWFRPAGDVKPAMPKSATTTVEPSPAPAPAPAPAPPTAGTPLPNPLASQPPADAPATQVAPPASVPGAASAAGPNDVQLVLAFRDFSWTEVKDRDGRVLLSRMNPGGTTQSVVGTPPLELVIGNASDVSVTYKGQAVDIAAHTRQNVARFTLP
jgi:cytoskeleton protein RodZ